jgi:hypothetical protein
LCANWLSLRDGFGLISKLFETSPELKQRPKDFTRDGPLSPELIVTLLLYLIADGGRRGYRHLLTGFWDEAKDHGLPLPTDEPVSAPAFCKARRKLKPEVLQALLDQVTEAFQKTHGSHHRFKGRRVLALDGSKISVQRSESLWSAFGGPTSGYCPQIMVSVLHDVIARMPVAATVAPYAASERDQIPLLLRHLRPGDILVLDRGYPSYELIQQLLDHGIDFVIRTPAQQTFHAVQTFLESGGDDYRILLADTHRKKHEPIEVRAIRSEGPDGQPNVILTSLRRRHFSRRDIRRLYAMRWEVELFYRLEKGDYIGHGQFRARSPEGVKQEVHAMLLFTALSRYFMAAASQLHDVPFTEVSQKGAILTTAAYLTRMFLATDERAAGELMTRLLERISRITDKPRPKRSCPRRSFRPRPRWGAGGRCGVDTRS